MDDRTLTALRASIVHWEENIAAETPSSAGTLSDDCPLCAAFGKIKGEWGSGRCGGCPVADRVEDDGCAGTPWEEANRALALWITRAPTAEYRDHWRAFAQNELDFLKSLLPENQDDC